MRRTLAASLLALVALLAPASRADDLHAHAVRRDGAITIDGRLDEPAWAAAPKQTGFIQRFPQDGGKAAFETSFAILYDDSAVYVGVWADDPDPAQIRRLLHRRDIDSTADWIAIGIDSYHDRRTAFGFLLNAAGVQRDILISTIKTPTTPGMPCGPATPPSPIAGGPPSSASRSTSSGSRAMTSSTGASRFSARSAAPPSSRRGRRGRAPVRRS
jgi:hypothetical protein